MGLDTLMNRLQIAGEGSDRGAIVAHIRAHMPHSMMCVRNQYKDNPPVRFILKQRVDSLCHAMGEEFSESTHGATCVMFERVLRAMASYRTDQRAARIGMDYVSEAAHEITSGSHDDVRRRLELLACVAHAGHGAEAAVRMVLVQCAKMFTDAGMPMSVY